jgi:pimeloyl-ACP methyl ester carboxylesterase
MVLLNPEGKVVMSTVLADKMERTLYQTFAPKERPVIGTTEELSIDGSLGKLAAVIQKPSLAQGQQCPMVMLCHGFGGSKEGLMFDLIADSLCAHGIASIRFDFNGHGKSEGEFVNMTVPNEIEDAKKVYEYVRDLRYVSKVGILGHSQGGVVASMTAGDFPEDFAAVVLMAPAAVLRDDAIRGSTMGKTYDPYDDMEYVDLWGKKLGRDYIKTAFRLPIYETAAHYHGPALIIHGTADRVVPYTYGLRYHQMWKGSEYEELEKFDHGFSQNVWRASRLASDFLIKTLK